jgi:uncharacterized glyoxalase superfamily protein PhnB
MARRAVPMIHVPDVRRTAGWYEALGFRLERWNGDGAEMDWALLRLGDSEVMFNAGGRASASERREVDLYLHTDDLEADWERLEGRVEIVEPIHDTAYGMREFIVRDVNRFWITFGQAIERA